MQSWRWSVPPRDPHPQPPGAGVVSELHDNIAAAIFHPRDEQVAFVAGEAANLAAFEAAVDAAIAGEGAG